MINSIILSEMFGIFETFLLIKLKQVEDYKKNNNNITKDENNKNKYKVDIYK